MLGNFASNLSRQLYAAGRTGAVVIGHSDHATPDINGAKSTSREAQDYRHGERVVFHNGDWLFSTNIKGRIPRKVIDYYIKKKKQQAYEYIGYNEIYTKETKMD